MYTVQYQTKATPAVTGLVFMQRFGLFLGKCGDVIVQQG